jgi:hypothetical protein
MDSINILLLIIIAYVVYTLTTSSTSNRKSLVNDFHNVKNKKASARSKNNLKYVPSKRGNNINIDDSRYGKHDDNKYMDDILDDSVSWDESYDSGFVKSKKVNSNFIENQFHNDYRDLITAFNNLVPDRKQLFNLPNIPLKYSEPEAAEVKNLVTDFVSVVNNNLDTDVPCTRNKNSGWDEAIPDPNVKSGWDKVQESLGLPVSLYEEPAGKAKVVLVDIPKVQKYETEDEIKYSIDLVLQKVNVDDQMLIKADFVQDKRPTTDENNFFTTKNVEMKVSIETIFAVGYLTKAGDNGNLTCGRGDELNIGSGESYNINNVQNYDGDKEKYYDYNKLEFNNMTDPKMVQRLLMEKYKKRNEEMEERTAMLDSEGQAYHASLPNVSEYANIRGSRSIYDDMNTPKLFE